MENRNTTPSGDRPQPPDKGVTKSADKPPPPLPIISLNNGHLPIKNNGSTSSSVPSAATVAAENGGGNVDVEASGPLLLDGSSGCGDGGKSAMVVSFGPGGARSTLSTNTFGRHLYGVPSSNASSSGLRRLIVFSCGFTLLGALVAALIILVAGGYPMDRCVNGKCGAIALSVSQIAVYIH